MVRTGSEVESFSAAPLSIDIKQVFGLSEHSLERDTWDVWMKGDAETAAALSKDQRSEDVLVSRLVSKAVGNVKNNTADLLEAL